MVPAPRGPYLLTAEEEEEVYCLVEDRRPGAGGTLNACGFGVGVSSFSLYLASRAIAFQSISYRCNG